VVRDQIRLPDHVGRRSKTIECIFHSTRPNFVAALQQQLGLRFDNAFAPEPVRVIDKIEWPVVHLCGIPLRHQTSLAFRRRLSALAALVDIATKVDHSPADERRLATAVAAHIHDRRSTVSFLLMHLQSGLELEMVRGLLCDSHTSK
jgi:hypothetical protein